MNKRGLRALFSEFPGVLLVLAVSGDAVGQTTVSDVDGNVYRVVEIGEQAWLATNLRVTRTPTGEPIGSFFFNDDSLGHARDGRLYTWDVAMNESVAPGVQGICPDGWHLPTDEEWRELFAYVDSAGAELLVGGSTGFDALLAGGADFRGNYLYYDTIALFWSSTEVSQDRAYHHHVDRDGAVGNFAAMKGARIFVRCIRD